jgi:FkbM family methyltransferase
MTTTGTNMEVTDRLDRLADAVRQLDGAVESLILNETAVLDGLAQMLGAVHQLQTRNDETLKKFGDQIHQFGLDLAAQLGARNLKRPIVVEAGKDQSQSPETGLLRHLYSFLPEPVAVDVGAHHGEIAEHLLDAGYSVIAFEPFPASFARLESKLQRQSSFRAYPWAIGQADESGHLHLAVDAGGRGGDVSLFHTLVPHSADEKLRFSESIDVPVHSLGGLVSDGTIPERIGLLKIDTEGSDLEVIRGMGSLRAAAVMAEFWDAEHEFARSGRGRLADLVSEMRNRGYRWYLVVYHVDHQHVISYYQNRSDTVPYSWGNVVFFESQGLQHEGLSWINDVLPPTRFR